MSVFPGVKGHVLECVGLSLGHPQAPVGSIVGDRMWGGDPGSQAASDGSCGGAEPGKEEAEAWRVCGCFGPRSMCEPPSTSWAGTSTAKPRSVCSCRMPSEDSQSSLLGEGRRLHFSCLPKCYCLYGLYGLRYLSSEIWEALEEK